MAMVTYDITVMTSEMDGAGTDSRIRCTLIGDQGSTNEFDLDSGGNQFERGAVDPFHIQEREIGELQRLRLRVEPKGLLPGWHLASVRVRNTQTGKQWDLPCNDWLAKGRNNLTRELTPV
jgi:hypothetical protein